MYVHTGGVNKSWHKAAAADWHELCHHLTVHESGMQVVVLMRQIVPYTWLNYAASAPPEITLPWYMLASVLGQVPHNAVDVYLGGNVTGLGDLLA